MGFSDILREAYQVRHEGYLHSIRESGMELNQTLDKIIDISKIGQVN